MMTTIAGFLDRYRTCLQDRENPVREVGQKHCSMASIYGLHTFYNTHPFVCESITNIHPQCVRTAFLPSRYGVDSLDKGS
jgi:hypothetical protein